MIQLFQINKLKIPDIRQLYTDIGYNELTEKKKGAPKMNIAAYCRVSKDKSDQLNSLEAQKGFFCEFAEKKS